MQTDEKQINIYECIPASLIEAHKGIICKIISFENLAGNNNINFEIMPSGGFSFRKESGYTTHQSIGKDLNTQKEVDEAIRKLLKSYNDTIYKFKDYDKRVPSQFFPLSYLKNISIELIDKKDKSPVYWSCLYKFEVPAYEISVKKDKKEERHETIKCIINNADLQIDVNKKGMIIGMQYNLLPFEKRQKLPMYNILTPDNKLPQVNYLINSQTANIMPFYLSTGETAYLPACKESIIPEGFLKNEELINISFINDEGEEIGIGISDSRKVIFVHDKKKIIDIIAANKSGQKFKLEDLTTEQYFEFPSFEIRQQIKHKVEISYDEIDNIIGCKIADFEVGGEINSFKEYDKKNPSIQISSGNIYREWYNGVKVYSNKDRAYIEEKTNNDLDPKLDINRDIVLLGYKWKWHTHPNVFWDKNNNKRTYQWLKREQMLDTKWYVGSNPLTGEKGFGPSARSIQNINELTGIVIDMKDNNTYFFNKNIKADLKTIIFFNYK